ncbi:MAG: hypothetical protein IKF71_03285 [Bacilli bacterium]|nr:hypothetical protein [Bacilli bacterium]
MLLGVLVVIQIVFGGFYFYHFWEELIPDMIILIFVSFVLMIGPFLFWIFNKKKLNYKKGRKICFFNSLILYLLFATPQVIVVLRGNTNEGMYSFDPINLSKVLIVVYLIVGIVYYFINMCFFVDNKKKEEK